jgi:hypothetical protein
LTAAEQPPRLTAVQRQVLVWGLIAIGLLAAVALAVAVVSRASSAFRGFGRAQPPVVTQDIVVERMREVAKLVASEMTLRDVVTYSQTRFGSRKRMLLVVTARVTAGIDLERGTQVEIDSARKRITVTLPPAEIFGVDVVNIRTYDERAGLLNPFQPADRDAIHQRIRAQLMAAANESGILRHADESAERVLAGLLAQDGYTVEIRRELRLERPAG